MARRRFQNGSVKQRGDVWIGRYLEDVRKNRSDSEETSNGDSISHSRIGWQDRDRTYGTAAISATSRQNQFRYLPRIAAEKDNTLFRFFHKKWISLILSQKKPSTQLTVRGHLEKHLLPALGKTEVSTNSESENVQLRLSNPCESQVSTPQKQFAISKQLCR